MLPANKRGLTTQNYRLVAQQGLRLPGRGNGDHDTRLIGRRLQLFHGAEYDVLELQLRLAGFSPSAVSNETLIVGPCFDSVSQASHAAIITAAIGISQIAESRRECPVVACGKGAGSLMLLMAHPRPRMVRRVRRSGRAYIRLFAVDAQFLQTVGEPYAPGFEHMATASV